LMVTYRSPQGEEQLWVPDEAFPRSGRDAWRKREQVGAVLETVCCKVRRDGLVVDACCGKGALTAALALAFPTCNVLGFDGVGFDRAWRSIRGYLRDVGLGNLRFEVMDLHSLVEDPWSLISEEPVLVVGLHPCGTLSDRVLRLAVEIDADVVLVVPCCYGRASPRVLREELGIRERVDVLKRALKEAEGSWEAQLLVCRWRASYLEEHGYSVRVGLLFGEDVSGRRGFLIGFS